MKILVSLHTRESKEKFFQILHKVTDSGKLYIRFYDESDESFSHTAPENLDFVRLRPCETRYPFDTMYVGIEVFTFGEGIISREVADHIFDFLTHKANGRFKGKREVWIL